MANKIQFKRGLKAQLPTLALGEPALCTDTQEVFVGTGSGNIQLGKQTDVASKVDKVAGKQLSTNDYTTAEKNKLANIAAGAQVNTVTSVAGKTGAVTVAKSDVGLGSVENYGIATQAEAEAGTSSAKYMTPIRTKQAIDKNLTPLQEQFNAHLADYATTQNITYYLDSVNGNDNNDGLSSTTPLKSFYVTVNKIPQIVNHTVTIVVKSGTNYVEDVKIGKNGQGAIWIKSDTPNQKFSIDGLWCEFNTSRLILEDFEILGGINLLNTAVWLRGCSYVLIKRAKVIAADKSINGITAEASIARITNSEISNKISAIHAIDGATVFTDDNSGTGNDYGLYAITSAKIGKNGTQPSGTTSEFESSGGQIIP